MRCPSCSARNPERADWCTQCFASLGPAATPPAAAPPGAAPPGAAPPGAAPTAAGERAVAPPAAIDPPGAAGEQAAPGAGASPFDVRERDGDVEWRCGSCQGWSALTAPLCTTCGSRRQGFGEDRDPGTPRKVAVGVALGSSLVLPGLGHLLAGSIGTGLARLGLFLLWAGAGIGSFSGGNAGSRAAGGVLLVGAVTLWAATAADVLTLLSGRGRQLLDGRRLGVLVGVVTGVLLLTAMITAFGLGR